jgi:uncharacterized OsmC-like protein
MRAVTRAGRFEIVTDEPETSGGTDTGPQPTDLLLASISSCFVLALAYVAKRLGVELEGLEVRAVGSYDGPRFARISMSVISDSPREVLEGLMPEAERLCYVSNTLNRQAELSIDLG